MSFFAYTDAHGNKRLSLTERIQKKLDDRDKPAKLPPFEKMFIRPGQNRKTSGPPPAQERTPARATKSPRNAR